LRFAAVMQGGESAAPTFRHFFTAPITAYFVDSSSVRGRRPRLEFASTENLVALVLRLRAIALALRVELALRLKTRSEAGRVSANQFTRLTSTLQSVISFCTSDAAESKRMTQNGDG
jgi:hypothetical protein